MQLSILQLNMWAGTHFPALKDLLEKNDFDILCFQEVAGVGVRSGNVNSTIDCYTELQHVLGATHHRELAIAQYSASNPTTGYFGNAIFYKKEFSLIATNVLWLYKRDTPFPSDAKSFEDQARNALHLTFTKDGKKFSVVTTHLAWANTEEEHPHQREQNLKLIEDMKQLKKPWILTGDFNIDPQQPSVVELEQLGRDLTKEYHIPNTIDPVNHVRWQRIKPGFAIDYIFVSPDIEVKEFKALDTVHMSDHIGLTAILEV